MRWDARWTLVLFATAAILYWLVQLSARPPSGLLESPRKIVANSTPLNAPQSPPSLNGIYEVSAGSCCLFVRRDNTHCRIPWECTDQAGLNRLYQELQPTVSMEIAKPSSKCLQTIEGVEMVYEMPLIPKAVLLLFHGCQHSCTDWWPASEACAACAGQSHAFKTASQKLHDSITLSLQSLSLIICWHAHDTCMLPCTYLCTTC